MLPLAPKHTYGNSEVQLSKWRTWKRLQQSVLLPISGWLWVFQFLNPVAIPFCYLLALQIFVQRPYLWQCHQKEACSAELLLSLWTLLSLAIAARLSFLHQETCVWERNYGINWCTGLGKQLCVMSVELYFTSPGVLVLLEQNISQICKMEISLALQLVWMNPNYKV